MKTLIRVFSLTGLSIAVVISSVFAFGCTQSTTQIVDTPEDNLSKLDGAAVLDKCKLKFTF